MSGRGTTGAATSGGGAAISSAYNAESQPGVFSQHANFLSTPQATAGSRVMSLNNGTSHQSMTVAQERRKNVEETRKKIYSRGGALTARAPAVMFGSSIDKSQEDRRCSMIQTNLQKVHETNDNEQPQDNMNHGGKLEDPTEELDQMTKSGSQQFHINLVHGVPKITISNVTDYALVGQIMSCYSGQSKIISCDVVKIPTEGKIHVKIEDRKDAENFAQTLTANGFEAKLNFVRELHDIPEAGEEGVHIRN